MIERRLAILWLASLVGRGIRQVQCMASTEPQSRPPLCAKTMSSSEVPIPTTSNGEETSASSSSSHLEETAIGELIKFGDSIVLLQDLATPEECRWLVQTSVEEAVATTSSSGAFQKLPPGLVRLPTAAAAQRAAATRTPCADALPEEVDHILQEILQRAATYLDDNLPCVVSTLFAESDGSLRNLLNNDQLQFASREPAINVYPNGGEFSAHQDSHALTILLPLSCPKDDFAGGGTAFWSQESRGHRVQGPDLVLKPRPGTAMLFGGCVTHAGVAVETGCRVVFVASFSRRET